MIDVFFLTPAVMLKWYWLAWKFYFLKPDVVRMAAGEAEEWVYQK